MLSVEGSGLAVLEGAPGTNYKDNKPPLWCPPAIHQAVRMSCRRSEGARAALGERRAMGILSWGPGAGGTTPGSHGDHSSLAARPLGVSGDSPHLGTVTSLLGNRTSWLIYSP